MNDRFSEVFSQLVNQKLGALALLGAIVSLLLAGRFEILSFEWILLLIAGTVFELAVFQDQINQIKEAENSLEDAQNRIEELLDISESLTYAAEENANSHMAFTIKSTKSPRSIRKQIDDIKEEE